MNVQCSRDACSVLVNRDLTPVLFIPPLLVCRILTCFPLRKAFRDDFLALSDKGGADYVRTVQPQVCDGTIDKHVHIILPTALSCTRELFERAAISLVSVVADSQQIPPDLVPNALRPLAGL